MSSVVPGGDGDCGEYEGGEEDKHDIENEERKTDDMRPRKTNVDHVDDHSG